MDIIQFLAFLNSGDSGRDYLFSYDGSPNDEYYVQFLGTIEGGQKLIFGNIENAAVVYEWELDQVGNIQELPSCYRLRVGGTGPSFTDGYGTNVLQSGHALLLSDTHVVQGIMRYTGAASTNDGKHYLVVTLNDIVNGGDDWSKAYTSASFDRNPWYTGLAKTFKFIHAENYIWALSVLGTDVFNATSGYNSAILQIDPTTGNPVDSRFVGFNDTDDLVHYPADLCYLNGNIYAAIWKQISGSSYYENLLYKLPTSNISGNTTAHKHIISADTVNGNSKLKITHVVTDGTYIYTISNDWTGTSGTTSVAVISKWDANLNNVWHKKVKPTETDGNMQVNTAMATSDGIVVCGKVVSSSSPKAYLFKLDTDGALLWENIYTAKNCTPNSIAPVGDELIGIYETLYEQVAGSWVYEDHLSLVLNTGAGSDLWRPSDVLAVSDHTQLTVTTPTIAHADSAVTADTLATTNGGANGITISRI